MYVVHSTFSVGDHQAEEVISIYKNRSRLVDKTEGFQHFLLLQNDKKPGELTVQLAFQTKGAYLSWVRSEEFKKIHELEKNYPDKELSAVIPTVRQFKVVAT
ncbi:MULTISPECIES: antibiotic biosynthesis monooxygenase family protein [Bacillaceae]|uniref:antibiotic biosynthesis monooxygenase family protein n=1 Tax=Bacillaceae TaxID=186817 RepID=UPI000E72478D|nr:antibiotic biosynthesis monooxygenase family protein [Bacillus sp. PK3_68]RJS61264.1 antibiotic biosynthesis monooxygenase [Bacillus sp. PK3_68]